MNEKKLYHNFKTQRKWSNHQTKNEQTFKNHIFNHCSGIWVTLSRFIYNDRKYNNKNHYNEQGKHIKLARNIWKTWAFSQTSENKVISQFSYLFTIAFLAEKKSNFILFIFWQIPMVSPPCFFSFSSCWCFSFR